METLPTSFIYNEPKVLQIYVQEDNTNSIVILAPKSKLEANLILGKLVSNEIQIFKNNKIINVNNIGFLHYKSDLLQSKKISDNILLPLSFNNETNAAVYKNIIEILDLNKDIDKYPKETSYFTNLRACIARIALQEPEVILINHISENLKNAEKKHLFIMLEKLKKCFDLNFVFISEDISLVKNFAEKLFVYENNTLIEENLDTAFLLPQTSSLKKHIKDSIIKALPDSVTSVLISQKCSEAKCIVKIAFSADLSQEAIFAYLVQELKHKINILQAYTDKLPQNNKIANVIAEIEINEENSSLKDAISFLKENNCYTEVIGYVPESN